MNNFIARVARTITTERVRVVGIVTKARVANAVANTRVTKRVEGIMTVETSPTTVETSQGVVIELGLHDGRRQDGRGSNPVTCFRLVVYLLLRKLYSGGAFL